MKRWISVLAMLILPQFLQAAQSWRATAGAEANNHGTQALAFLPNEMWIRAGDSITWTFPTPEIHTVSFLPDGHTRLPFSVGCPGFFGPPSYDGSTCLTTPPMLNGQSYAVTFPTAGNFKLVCLVHENMTATIHVLAPSAPLPHNQDFYDKEAQRERSALLSNEGDNGDHGDHGNGAKNAVTAGNGKVVANGGGSETVSHMRFMDDKASIRAGDTLEWTNEDPVTPHTITFGTEPDVDHLIPPSSNVTMDPDGARHATINSTSDNVHSGFVVAGPQERLFVGQLPLGPTPVPPPFLPLGVTRFRVTFPNAGVYPYKCSLHDNLGMTGTVTVK
jgi:plastocyanin